jgi:hypothetical protein
MRNLFLITLTASALAFAATSPLGAQQQNWIFMTHAAFYADLTQDSAPIDPQVFVRDPSSAGGSGPQNISHSPGFRPENQAVDNHVSPLFNANGKPLGVNIGKWLNAAGTVDVDSSGAGDRLHFGFTGLVESGHYSLFRLTPGTGVLVPLDGSGTANTFSATPLGTGDLYVNVPDHVTPTDRIILYYNSDGNTHADQPGALGIDSHAQMVMRVRLV